ncbi:hypothetical protein DESC_700080 [Desulfosarcina cetonica]|nr:hypothetical protein DESC_700080 [Desulfosarcina cetonica]
MSDDCVIGRSSVFGNMGGEGQRYHATGVAVPPGIQHGADTSGAVVHDADPHARAFQAFGQPLAVIPNDELCRVTRTGETEANVPGFSVLDGVVGRLAGDVVDVGGHQVIFQKDLLVVPEATPHTVDLLDIAAQFGKGQLQPLFGDIDRAQATGNTVRLADRILNKIPGFVNGREVRSRQLGELFAHDGLHHFNPQQVRAQIVVQVLPQLAALALADIDHLQLQAFGLRAVIHGEQHTPALPDVNALGVDYTGAHFALGIDKVDVHVAYATAVVEQAGQTVEVGRRVEDRQIGKLGVLDRGRGAGDQVQEARVGIDQPAGLPVGDEDPAGTGMKGLGEEFLAFFQCLGGLAALGHFRLDFTAVGLQTVHETVVVDGQVADLILAGEVHACGEIALRGACQPVFQLPQGAGDAAGDGKRGRQNQHQDDQNRREDDVAQRFERSIKLFPVTGGGDDPVVVRNVVVNHDFLAIADFAGIAPAVHQLAGFGFALMPHQVDSVGIPGIPQVPGEHRMHHHLPLAVDDVAVAGLAEIERQNAVLEFRYIDQLAELLAVGGHRDDPVPRLEEGHVQRLGAGGGLSRILPFILQVALLAPDLLLDEWERRKVDPHHGGSGVFHRQAA